MMEICTWSCLAAIILPMTGYAPILKVFWYLYSAIGVWLLLSEALSCISKPYLIGYDHGVWAIMFFATLSLLIARIFGASETGLHHAAEIQRLQGLLQLKDVEMARLQSERAAEQAEATKQLAAKDAFLASLASKDALLADFVCLEKNLRGRLKNLKKSKPPN